MHDCLGTTHHQVRDVLSRAGEPRLWLSGEPPRALLLSACSALADSPSVHLERVGSRDLHALRASTSWLARGGVLLLIVNRLLGSYRVSGKVGTTGASFTPQQLIVGECEAASCERGMSDRVGQHLHAPRR